MAFIDDLRKYQAKVTVTHRKWESFIKTVKDPSKYSEHTKMLSNAYLGIRQCCEMVANDHKTVKFRNDIDFKTIFENWDRLEEGISKVITAHQD